MPFIEIVAIKNWEEEVAQADSLVLVDFQAPWCQSVFRKEMAAEAFLDKWGGMVRVGTLDVSRYPEIALRYRIHEVPTLALFDRGRILKAYIGSLRVGDMAQHVFTFAGLKEIGVLSE
jgi:thioredoxin-like negative regulator of GroEL